MSSAMHSPYAANAPRQPIPHVPHGSTPAAAAVPAGTFAPGTKVQVGNHRVVVEKYLSEGGFAHLYLVRLPKPVDGEEVAALKRVAVPDKEALTNMRTEVETMKKLKGHRHIVRYIDSHASQLKGGGYEVFLLMEYCNGGGLIDFMNTRLQNRLTEPEIIKIFSDVSQGVACMHYLKPPLLHRDLKVENVLITTSGSSRQFKLCDFGSTAPSRPAATNAAEGRLIEEDVQRHTTMQYRSPEMIDVYRKQPIDEKSDIWALGVLLYKLCYYTTPFEEQGQMAILNASFKFPGYPPFTDRLKKLIAMMLQEKPRSRPNIYQVVKEVCLMRGTEIPIHDIYAGRTASEARRNQELPPPPSAAASPPVVGAYKSMPVEEKTVIPDITPMRRGRPTQLGGDKSSTRPSPSPRRVVASDPFAALDSSKPNPGTNEFDDISKRFPSLDQFSLLHEPSGKFAFDQQPQTPSQPRDISQRVTEVLADEAFARPPTPKAESAPPSKPGANLANRISAGTQTTNIPRSSEPVPQIPKKSAMVSTGTMTSPQASVDDKYSDQARPIWRIPQSNDRSSSQPRPSVPPAKVQPEKELLLRTRPSLSEYRSKSQTATLSSLKAPLSARPSLDSHRTPFTEFEDQMNIPKSDSTRSRPLSATFESAARFLRSRSPSQSKLVDSGPIQAMPDEDTSAAEGETARISSNVDFLRAMEEEEPTKRKEKRHSSSSKSGKRTSMPSISLSGTKSLLAGRFGDAFKKFEGGNSSADYGEGFDSNLTPITGSVATDGRSDDGQVLEETEEMPPEMRRELERRRLSQEERRVAEAAAAYKQRVSESGPSGGGRPRDTSRAALIQNKVQSLLDESNKASPTKTAEGYGRFTNSPQPGSAVASPVVANAAVPPRKLFQQPPAARTVPQSLAPASTQPQVTKPNAPPKPQVLRTGGSVASPTVAAKPTHLSNRPSAAQPVPTLSKSESMPISPEDWEANFSKRYPSLAGLEMVETEIDPGRRIIRDV